MNESDSIQLEEEHQVTQDNQQPPAGPEQDQQGEQKPDALKTDYLDLNQLPEDVRPLVEKRLSQETAKNYRNAAKLAKLNQLERENEELRRQVDEHKKPREVAKPNVDDAIDDPEKFKIDQEKYDAYLLKQAKYEASQEALRLKQEQDDNVREQEKINTYVQRAAQSGIDPVQLDVSEKMVSSYLNYSNAGGLIQDELMLHENGPKIIQYLANNQESMNRLIAAPSITEAVRIIDSVNNTFNQPPSKKYQPDDGLRGGKIQADENPYGRRLR